MKKLIAILLAVAMMTGIVPTTAVEVTSEQAAPELIPEVADFTVDIFRHAFAEDPSANTFVSPLSVLLALVMTANGANGSTRDEMEAVLGRGIALAELNRLLSDYVNGLPSTEKSSLSIANSIWYDEGRFTVIEEFLSFNQQYFDAEIVGADFDDPDMVDRINAWVAEKTEDMITEILDEICCCIIMYLINAIAFDAEWEVKLDDRHVSKGEFTAADGSEQTADFMRTLWGWNANRGMRYIETDNARGFTKPYKDNHYSFAAILPDEDIDITDFIAEMTGESLMNALNSARVAPGGIRASIPKFGFEYDINMNDLLTEMGMPTAFDEEYADFSKLGTPLPGRDPIHISRVLHKTFIEVDQIGTRAGAATVVEMSSPASVPSPPEVVDLDRPFVFAIVDNATNLPIFIGSLLEIAKSERTSSPDTTRAANIFDALEILKDIVGMNEEPLPLDPWDINGDGEINIFDALEVLKGLVGMRVPVRFDNIVD